MLSSLVDFLDKFPTFFDILNDSESSSMSLVSSMESSLLRASKLRGRLGVECFLLSSLGFGEWNWVSSALSLMAPSCVITVTGCNRFAGDSQFAVADFRSETDV